MNDFMIIFQLTFITFSFLLLYPGTTCTNMGHCCRSIYKFLCRVSDKIKRYLVFLAIADLITDGIALDLYWKEQSETVAILATVFFVASAIIGLVHIYLAFNLLCRLEFLKQSPDAEDNITLQKWIDKLTCLEAMVESIPQMALALYVTLLCNKEEQTFYYIQLLVSFLAATHGVTAMDDVFNHLFDFSTLFRCGCLKDRSDSDDTKLKQTRAHYISVFLIKGLALAARILLFASGTLQKGWKIIFLPLLPCILLSICTILYMSSIDKDDEFGKIGLKMCRWTGISFFFCAIFAFIWLSFRPQYTLLFSLIYGLVNLFYAGVVLNDDIWKEWKKLFTDIGVAANKFVSDINKVKFNNTNFYPGYNYEDDQLDGTFFNPSDGFEDDLYSGAFMNPNIGFGNDQVSDTFFHPTYGFKDDQVYKPYFNFTIDPINIINSIRQMLNEDGIGLYMNDPDFIKTYNISNNTYFNSTHNAMNRTYFNSTYDPVNNTYFNSTYDAVNNTYFNPPRHEVNNGTYCFTYDLLTVQMGLNFASIALSIIYVIAWKTL